MVAAVSPEGKLVLHSVDQGTAHPVPGVEAGWVPVSWSNDGREIFVSRRQEIPAEIYRLNITTGHATLWKELIPSDPTGILTLGPIVITPSGKYYAYSFIRDLS
jgi:Tol biopolymer transport system component